MDFLYSIKTFMSTWIVPKETGSWGASGSLESCEAFGFIGHGSALSSAMYNASLAIYFALTIAFSCKERDISGTYIEYCLHLVPLLTGWGTAIVGLPLDFYNSIGWTCWIAPYPLGCGSELYPCTRSDPQTVNISRWVFFHLELWASFLVCVIAMTSIFLVIRKQEKKMERYEFERIYRMSFSGDGMTQQNGAIISTHGMLASRYISNNNSNQQRASISSSPRQQQQQQQDEVPLSKKVATQAFLYCLLFFVTWIFPMAQFLVSQITGYLFFPMLCITVIINPLQGFFDAVIYLRPRYLKYRRKLHVQQQRQNGTSNSSRPVIVISMVLADDDDCEGETYEPVSNDEKNRDVVASSSGEQAIPDNDVET